MNDKTKWKEGNDNVASFNVYTAKDGQRLWEYRISFKESMSNKKREKRKRGFFSKAEARKAAFEMEMMLKGEINNGIISQI